MALSMERTMILVPLTMDGSMDYLAMAPSMDLTMALSMDLAMDDCIDYLTMVLSMDIPWTLQWTF